MKQCGIPILELGLDYGESGSGQTRTWVEAFLEMLGMHIFTITCNLSSHYHKVYDRRGAYVLALASLAGWASALTLNMPTPLVLNMVAFVVGGVVVSAAIAELPKEREGRYWSFLTGARVYAALLLILSHFEKGGLD